MNRTALVPPGGLVNLPLAGSVQAQGRTVEQVQAEIAARLAPNFAAPPNVFVGIQSIFTEPEPPVFPPEPVEDPTIAVFVIGEAGSSGRLELEPGATLLQAIAEMGGFTPFAATRRIQLRRTDPATGRETVYAIDYAAIERGTSPNGTATLQDGDVGDISRDMRGHTTTRSVVLGAVSHHVEILKPLGASSGDTRTGYARRHTGRG